MTDAGEAWRERVLRDAAVRGDPAAWRALFDSAFEAVARYVRWRAGGLADLADDAVQETWLVAVRRLSTFDPTRGPFAGWVCGIAARVVRNAVRGRLRYKRRVGPLGDADPAGPDRDRSERVAMALAELSDRYERVLRAKYLDAATVDEIAAAWGETPKAVESLLGRAREAFRQAFDRGDGY